MDTTKGVRHPRVFLQDVPGQKVLSSWRISTSPTRQSLESEPEKMIFVLLLLPGVLAGADSVLNL